MTDFEKTLREQIADYVSDYILGEDATPAEADAYRLGANHAATEAVQLFEVEIARELERREAESFALTDVFDEVRTTFAIDWERSSIVPDALATVDETISRTWAVIDSMGDCE